MAKLEREFSSLIYLMEFMVPRVALSDEAVVSFGEEVHQCM